LYSDWCLDNGMKKLNNTNFSKEMISQGFEKYRTTQERGFRIIRSA
jgi:hypothetical protein